MYEKMLTHLPFYTFHLNINKSVVLIFDAGDLHFLCVCFSIHLFICLSSLLDWFVHKFMNAFGICFILSAGPCLPSFIFITPSAQLNVEMKYVICRACAEMLIFSFLFMECPALKQDKEHEIICWSTHWWQEMNGNLLVFCYFGSPWWPWGLTRSHITRCYWHNLCILWEASGPVDTLLVV